MKPSEVWSQIEKFINEIMPALDTIAAALEGGSVTPAQAHLQALGAVHENLGKIGDGHIIQALITNLPQIIQIVTTIIGLFGKTTPPAAA